MATAIIIFGAAVRRGGQPSPALRQRVEAALRHGRTLSEVLYVPTGAVGRHGPAEAEVMARMLRNEGVPEERIVQEATGWDTVSSVRACAALLRLRGHTGPVLAATSAYHMPRCVVLLRLAALPARACPPPRVPAARRMRTRWYWRLREAAALPVDAAHMAALRALGKV